MTTTSSSFSVKHVDDAMVVQITDDRIDAINHEQIFAELRRLCEEKEMRLKLLLDFENVQYFYSLVLGELARLTQKLVAAGGDLRLCCVQPAVQQVFVVTRLNEVVHLYPTEKAALEGWTLPERQDAKADSEPADDGQDESN